MIVELFGPPGVGKTTFAQTLAVGLRERGFRATFALSYRPSENPSIADADGLVRQWFPALRRVTRPVIESLLAANRLPADSREARAATVLRNLFPPHDVIMALKMRQYVLRLSCEWHDAARSDDVVIFDQAYVQLICTLASLVPTARPDDIETALDAVPQPDLLIRLTAPADILRARLAERRRRMSTIERLFELDIETNLRAAQVADRLHDLMQKRTQMVAIVESLDQRSLRAAVDKVEEIVSRMRARPFTPSGVEFEGAA